MKFKIGDIIQSVGIYPHEIHKIVGIEYGRYYILSPHYDSTIEKQSVRFNTNYVDGYSELYKPLCPDYLKVSKISQQKQSV